MARLRLTDSLQGDLVLRLAFVLLVVLGLVFWQIERTLDKTGDMAQQELLRRQAAEVMNGLTLEKVGRGGRLKVALSPETAAAYINHDNGYAYYIQDEKGRMLAQSDALASVWLQSALDQRPTVPTILDTRVRDGESSALYMLIQPVFIPGGPLYVIVGQERTIDDVLLNTSKAALQPEMLAILAGVFILALAGMAGLIRQGLVPLRRLSKQVVEAGQKIRLGKEAQISTAGVPREIRPVVESFNAVLAELSKSMLAQQALTADTAHQLKTPLAVLQARLEQMGDFAGKREVERDVQRMNRLVRQLLHYAVLAQHPATLEKADVVPVVRDVVAGMVPLARQAKVDVDFVAPELPVQVLLDSLQVAEAVGNLVDNAIRYSPAKAKVEVEVMADGTVEVRDRGPGIAAKEQALVFTRFWQGPDGESAHGGAGLGLAVVAEIMRQHGGNAKVESRQGGGSVFRLGFRLA